MLALRVFADDEGRMNEALGPARILCVSQFTLYADTRHGNRPSFTEAAPAEHAERLYERFCERHPERWAGASAPTWRSSWSTTGP